VKEGFHLLTGAPCEQLVLRAEQQQQSEGAFSSEQEAQYDADELWMRLLSFREQGFLMGASCGGTGVDNDAAETMGLLTSHAYSLLDVKELTGARIVKLRNPWGRGQKWRGDWGPDDRRWQVLPSEIRNQFLAGGSGSGSSSSGVFCMGFSDVLLYFRTIDVCKIRPAGWPEVRTGGNFYTNELPYSTTSRAAASDMGSNCFEVFELTVLQTTMVDITMHQATTRSSDSMADHNQVDMGFCVFLRKADRSLELVKDCKREVKPTVHCDLMMSATKEGECYLLVPMGFNQLGLINRHPFVLVLHSAQPVLLAKREEDASLMARAMVARAKEVGTVKIYWDGIVKVVYWV
jgi:calpain-15